MSKINELKIDKAAGPDGITNGMLKNAGPLAKTKLLEMYNNVLVRGGDTPES